MIRAQPTAPSAKLNSITHMPLAAGYKLGPYEILAPIGAGGMGDVYKARDSRLEFGISLLYKVVTEAGDFLHRLERTEIRSSLLYRW